LGVPGFELRALCLGSLPLEPHSHSHFAFFSLFFR
jgi:hypothetical protein